MNQPQDQSPPAPESLEEADEVVSQDVPEADASAEESNSDDSAAALLAEAEAKVSQYHDEMLRVRAEAENVRKRAIRDAEQARKFALERMMGDLLDVKDSLERGLDAADAEGAAVEKLREGTDLTLKMLSKALDKQGLTEIDPAGEAFDPEQHEALSMVPTPDHEPDTVVTVIQKGYLLNDRLLRPARVMVAKALDE